MVPRAGTPKQRLPWFGSRPGAVTTIPCGAQVMVTSAFPFTLSKGRLKKDQLETQLQL